MPYILDGSSYDVLDRGYQVGTGEQSFIIENWERSSPLAAYNGDAAPFSVVSGGGSGDPEPYTTYVLGPGEQFSRSLGDNDSLSNVLVDARATDADVIVNCLGSGWSIQNFGVIGPVDLDGSKYMIRGHGNGTIHHCYLGDGVTKEGTSREGLLIASATHDGHVDVTASNFGGGGDNGCYVAGPARLNPPGQTDGQGGTYGFDGCYFHDNNVAHARIASDGSFVHNSVMVNHNNVPPITSSGGLTGVINSRGLYTGYGDPGQTVDVFNCDIDLTPANTCDTSYSWEHCTASVAYSPTNHATYGECSILNIHDSRLNGSWSGNVVTSNISGSPNTAIPDGVPATAEQAASGGGGGFPVYEGDNALRSEALAGGTNVIATDSLNRLPHGKPIVLDQRFYLDGGTLGYVMFAVQNAASEATALENCYAVGLDSNLGELVLVKRVANSTTFLQTTASVAYPLNEHCRVRIEWDDGTLGGLNNDLTATVYDEAGSFVADVTANSADGWTGGGIGYWNPLDPPADIYYDALREVAA